MLAGHVAGREQLVLTGVVHAWPRPACGKWALLLCVLSSGGHGVAVGEVLTVPVTHCPLRVAAGNHAVGF